MYLPKQFEETRPGVLHGVLRDHPFATLVVMTNDGLSVDHIPFLLSETSGPLGVLRGHVARANPILKTTLLDVDAVAIFQGPDHYITPSWYPTKQDTGKVVPTWNYVVVHAYGRLEFIDDVEWLRTQVHDLTRHLEASREPAWQVSDAPSDFITKQLSGIVGVEMPIARLAGKWKLGQNRSEADRLGMVEGLLAEPDTTAAVLAGLVEMSLRGKT